MIRRFLHNRIYLIPGILHMMTSLCFMIYCIRHFHSQTFIVFPLLSLMFSLLILPSAVLSIVISVFYCNTRTMHRLKKIQMIFAIVSASVHGVCLLALAILIFMGTFDVETMILLVLFEFVLAILSSIFLTCFSTKKKDKEEESKYMPNRKNSFIITRPTVMNEIPHMDQYVQPQNPYRHTYSSENMNSDRQTSSNVEELPNSQNGFRRGAYTGRSFQVKPACPQVTKFNTGPKYQRPGGLRVQNLRQCSISIDDYPSSNNYSHYTKQTEALVNHNNYTEQGIIDLGQGYQNQSGYESNYSGHEEYPDEQNVYKMHCPHYIEDSYNESGLCEQCYIHSESSSIQQEFYMQEVPNDTEDSASNTDKQSDLYASHEENESVKHV